MDIIDTEVLSYLHDSKLIGVAYDASASPRVVVLRLVCHPQAGYVPWDGQRLALRLEDTAIIRLHICGGVMGSECVDAWAPKVSDEMEAELSRLERAGMDVSGTRFTLTFNTGSCVEGVARRVSVDIERE